MKKYIIIFFVIANLVLGAMLLFPMLFEDDIKKEVSKAAEKYVEATVSFDGFGLSFFGNFPDLTVSLEGLSIIGHNAFEGDTLLTVKNFDVAVDVMSLMGDNMEIVSVELIEPYVNVKVLKDGTANYDIYKGSKTAEETPTEESSAGGTISLEYWAIESGHIRYNDASLNTAFEAKGFNHSGSGQLDADVFDLDTKTAIEQVFLDFDGTSYFSGNAMALDMILGMDMAQSKYTFKDNVFKINDFPLSFDGFFAMPEGGGYEMDIRYSAPESSFGSLLSLVPPSFMEGYENLKTEGKLTFDGEVKGTYDDTKGKMPRFRLGLNVADAMVQYPDLPTAITGINVKMDVKKESDDDDLEKMIYDIATFAMNLGNNPISGKARVQGLSQYDIDADVHAKVNLAELGEIFPMDSFELKGLYTLDLTAKGLYSDTLNLIPKIDAQMTLENGYVRSLAYPDIPLTDMSLRSAVKNTNGNMNDTQIALEKLGWNLDNKPFNLTGNVVNLDDPTYNMQLDGEVDLGKMAKVFGLEEDMEIDGMLSAHLKTQGKMSDLEAERYEKLPTSGTMGLKTFRFVSADLPQGFRLSEATLEFSPRQMTLKNMKGYLGKSDIDLTGYLTNYLAYGLYTAGMREQKTILSGKMKFNSQTFDANEWVTDEEEEVAATEEDTTGVYPIPDDVDFRFETDIKRVLYDNMTLENFNGVVVMQNGQLKMNNVAFSTIGGKFLASGTYDTRDIQNPKFDFDMNIANAQVAEAFRTFNTVQTFAPMAKAMTGQFNTNLKLSGVLGQDMMPKYETLTGGGLISLLNASLSNDKVMNKISESTGAKALKNTQLQDIIMQTRLEDGKLKVQPFTLDLGQDIKAQVGGNTSLDGEMDYTIQLDLPKEQAEELLKGLGAGSLDAIAGERIELDLKLTGLYDSPKVSLDKNKLKERIKGNLKDKAIDALQKIKNDTTEDKSLKDKLKDQFGGFGKKKDGGE